MQSVRRAIGGYQALGAIFAFEQGQDPQAYRGNVPRTFGKRSVGVGRRPFARRVEKRRADHTVSDQHADDHQRAVALCHAVFELGRKQRVPRRKRFDRGRGAPPTVGGHQERKRRVCNARVPQTRICAIRAQQPFGRQIRSYHRIGGAVFGQAHVSRLYLGQKNARKLRG